MKTTGRRKSNFDERTLKKIVSFTKQARFRENREAAERLIATLKSVSDEDLLSRICEIAQDREPVTRVDAMGDVSLDVPGIHHDIFRYVAIKRGLLQPSDDEREHFDWIEREFAHPGGLH